MRKFYKEARVTAIVLIVLAILFFLMKFDFISQYTNHKLKSGHDFNWVETIGLLIWYSGIFWIFIRLNKLSSSKSRVKKSSIISLIGVGILFFCQLVDYDYISIIFDIEDNIDIYIFTQKTQLSLWSIGIVSLSVGVLIISLLYPSKSLSRICGWTFVIMTIILIPTNNSILLYRTFDLWCIIQPIIHLLSDLSLGLFVLGLSKHN